MDKIDENDKKITDSKVNPFKMDTYDIVRMRINKLMANPDVPVVIPESTRNQKPKPPPEFVRNVWGSAAGVGSGDFHIYRGIRRREYARLEFIENQAKEKLQEDEFTTKIQERAQSMEVKTAKKRAKRQKKKQAKRSKKDNEKDVKNESSDESTDEKAPEFEVDKK